MDGKQYLVKGGRMLEVVVNGEGFGKARAKFLRLRSSMDDFEKQKPSPLLTGKRHPNRRRKPSNKKKGYW